MSNVTNLDRFRKQRARSEATQKADENAIKFGRTKAQKDLEEARRRKAARDLDGKKSE